MTIQLGEKDNNAEVKAHAADVLAISLPENATAGYRWALDSADPTLFAEEEHEAAYPSKTPGSGGMATLHVRVVAAGSGILRLKYWRAFEGEAGIIQRFAVRVQSS